MSLVDPAKLARATGHVHHMSSGLLAAGFASSTLDRLRADLDAFASRADLPSPTPARDPLNPEALIDPEYRGLDDHPPLNMPDELLVRLRNGANELELLQPDLPQLRYLLSEGLRP